MLVAPESDFTPPTFPERFNLAHYFLDARIEEGRGARTAIRCGERRLTYREVQRLSNGAARTLRGAGVEAEDRVLLALPDSPEFVAAYPHVADVVATASDAARGLAIRGDRLV